MVEVFSNLYVGNQDDFEHGVKGKDGWSVVHAAKKPYHRQLLGYKTRSAPKDHPEYFWAQRGDELFLNLIDAQDPKYIPMKLIYLSLDFITSEIDKGQKVLVHCNKGMSRSPSIAFLWMRENGCFGDVSFGESVNKFKSIYPSWNPGKGMIGVIEILG